MSWISRVYAYKKIYNEYAFGSKEKAFELYNAFLPYLSIFHGQFEMFYEKYVLVKRGVFKTYHCRQPIVCPEPEIIAEFERRCEWIFEKLYNC